MFDSSSYSSTEPSREQSPKITFAKVNPPSKSKIKQNELLSFFSSKTFYIISIALCSIPLIAYQQERPSLYCTKGLYYFCKPCPKNSQCLITTFRCFENTTQFHNKCINGVYNHSFLEEVYSSYENGRFNKNEASYLSF